MSAKNSGGEAPFMDTTFPGLVSVAAGLAMWIWGQGDGLVLGLLLVGVAVIAGIYCISVSKAYGAGAQALGWVGNILAGVWLFNFGAALG